MNIVMFSNYFVKLVIFIFRVVSLFLSLGFYGSQYWLLKNKQPIQPKKQPNFVLYSTSVLVTCGNFRIMLILQ